MHRQQLLIRVAHQPALIRSLTVRAAQRQSHQQSQLQRRHHLVAVAEVAEVAEVVPRRLQLWFNLQLRRLIQPATREQRQI